MLVELSSLKLNMLLPIVAQKVSENAALVWQNDFEASRLAQRAYAS